MKTNFGVIIVGGGLIGLSVAYGLARRGHDCLLLDSSDNNYVKICFHLNLSIL